MCLCAGRRPARPTRPPLPYPPKPSQVDDITITTSQSTLISLDSGSVVPNTHPEAFTHTQCCDLLNELCSPLTSHSAAQSNHWDQSSTTGDVGTSSQVLSERPKPRPRSRLSVQPISSEVKVQTLVKLREDGLATLAARAGADTTNQEVSQGKYLQELLEAFSADDWGFPDRHSDSSEHSQSEGDEEEDETDMATLKARIQAFEQQPVADGSCGVSNNRDFAATKRPEPRPRPRLQGQQAKSVPPTVAPKPKILSHASKPSTKLFREDSALITVDPCSSENLKITETSQTANEPTPSFPLESGTTLLPQPCKNTEKPPVTPKPGAEGLPPGTSVPVPAPRPPVPKLTPSFSETSSLANPRPPPRPRVAPRASIGATKQEKDTGAGNVIPTLPSRPSSGAQTETGSEETQDSVTLTGECSAHLLFLDRDI